MTLPAFDDDVWELYDGSDRLQPGPRPRRRAARDAGQAAAAVAHRGDQVQRAADGRPHVRAARAADGRPPDPHPRQLTAVLPRAWAGCRRTASSASRTSRSRSPPRSRCPDGGANGVIIAQGGRFGGWASTPRTAGRSSSTTCSASRSSPPRPTEPIPAGHAPGAHGVRLRRWRAGQGWRRHPVLRRRPRSAPAGSRPPSRWSSPPTRPRTSATSRARPSPPTTRPATSRFTGRIHWVQIDLGDDDHDHFIDPDERLRIAMARQ